MGTTAASPPGPLADVAVVDLSRLLPGPLAARLLADLGARVVKVEEPRLGDPVRQAPPLVGGTSSLAALLLAGVESVALDLKRPAAREVLHRLLARADVLLDTFRPGTLARLDLAPEELAQRYPRLVHCSLTGWGETGPYAARAGHDLTYQAVAGALAPLVGDADQPAVPIADVAGAWSAVASILAALHARQHSGRGSRIDASLFDAAVHANVTAWAAAAGGAGAVGEALPLAGGLACYRVYLTADGGRLAVGALEPHFWRRLCTAAGRPDLARRQFPRGGEARHRLEAEVAVMVASRTREAWRHLLESIDVPVEPVLSLDEARRHPQTRARGLLAERGGTPRLAFPARFDGRRPPWGGRVPALGEHTARVSEEARSRPRRRRATAGCRAPLQPEAVLPPAPPALSRGRRRGRDRADLQRGLLRWRLGPAPGGPARARTFRSCPADPLRRGLHRTTRNLDEVSIPDP